MKTKYKVIIILVIFFVMIIIQIAKDIEISLISRNISLEDWYWQLSYLKSNNTEIKDNPLLYGDDEEDVKINDLYVIVYPSYNEKGENLTLELLNSITDFTENNLELDVKVLNLDSNKDFDLREYKDANISKNGTIKLRGHSTMEDKNKSYKIKILEEGETFLGHNILNLNKHPYDYFKVRNKIAFELIEKIPNLISMRTSLVNLYIKDLTKGEDEGFKDYGLFTNIEQANSKFLEDRNLDTKGYFYKAENFEFMRYEDIIKPMNDPEYNEEEFEDILEIKVSNSHDKIIKMLEDVNNENLDINQVLDKHFNRENYFTWVATNILLGNYDTQTQNYFLYSPSHSLTWYFVPWDYDGSMSEEYAPIYDSNGDMVSLTGVANYWNGILHNRVFREANNLRELNKKVNEIYKILSKEAVEKEVNKYLPIIEKYYVDSSLSLQSKEYEKLYSTADTIINITNLNKRLYFETLEKPMPIYLLDVTKVEDGYLFEWSSSFDLQGDGIRYVLEISETYDFEDIVYQKKRLRGYHHIVDLKPGEYYWRVIAIDDKGNTQRAFDQIIVDDNIYYGIRKIVIE